VLIRIDHGTIRLMDRLSVLLERFPLRAEVTADGRLPGAAEAGHGQLLVLGQGRLEVREPGGRRQELAEPGLLLLPRPLPHGLEVAVPRDAEVVGAALSFGRGDENPLLAAMPACLVLALARVPALEGAHRLLLAEAQGRRCGHGSVTDRLAEVLVVQLLRHAIEQRLVDVGPIAGLSDPRLHKALTALHAEPARPWTLESMAAQAGMSRARFAARFAQRVGMPPGAYLAGWRIGLARALLRRGLPVKRVAAEVGYASASALGRAFQQRVGQAPSVWQRLDRLPPPDPARRSEPA
jgi:AraC-like DNA-binding protein